MVSPCKASVVWVVHLYVASNCIHVDGDGDQNQGHRLLLQWLMELGDFSEWPLLHIFDLESSLEPTRKKMYGSNNEIKWVINKYNNEIIIYNSVSNRQQGESGWDFWEMYAKVKPLLCSLPGFNQVPLLQTLEPVLEDTALWLHGDGGTRSDR